MWDAIYREQILGVAGVGNEEGEAELTEEDIPDLDAFMAEQERAWKQEQNFQDTLSGKRVMSGAQAPIDWRANQPEALQWGPWQ